MNINDWRITWYMFPAVNFDKSFGMSDQLVYDPPIP